MPRHLPVPRCRCRHRRLRPCLESLESRTLPSGTAWPGLLNPASENQRNDTLDLAQDLGDLSVSGRAEVVGTLGNAPAASADVDWYRFLLDRVTTVTLATLPNPGHPLAAAVLSLYNDDPLDFSDPYDPLGHRLLTQDDGAQHGGLARIEHSLAPGSYYLAVSGSGNAYFHPYLANSGTNGSTGDYGLLITGNENGFNAADGPRVLASEPAATAALDRSPLVIRVDLSAALEPKTIVPGQTVQLLYNSSGSFGQGNDQSVSLAGPPNFTAKADELQLIPASALKPGYYHLVLAGDSSSGQPVLTDLSGNPLGKDSAHASGQNITISFQITGIEGNAGTSGTGDDTLATAHQLGELTLGQLVQVPGAIGADSSSRPANPANDVDLYHFRLTTSGRYAFVAEAFAGRIGSPLDTALSLFRVNPATNQLDLVLVNDNTLNDTRATNGSYPLSSDSALYAGLTAGDYYVAMSSSGNLPNPQSASFPGSNGRIFDGSNSSQAGISTGDYVLNLFVAPAPKDPPQVLAVTPQVGNPLAAPPTQFTVQFSQILNLQQLASQSTQRASNGQLPAVYIRGSDGTIYYPRLTSYDLTTKLATFLMLDALPNGVNELHLSGPLGLADLAGTPLAGNDSSGDYVVPFTVDGPARGSPGNPLLWSDQEPNDDPAHPQNLGVLFPHELEAHANQTGVQIVRDFTNSPSSAPADSADYYQFQVLQSRPYVFNLLGSGLPNGSFLTVADASGHPLHLMRPGGRNIGLIDLNAGTYVVGISGWSADQAARVTYHLTISLGTSSENPTPLTVGPAPAYRIVLAAYLPANPQPPASPPSAANTGSQPSGSGPPAANTIPSQPSSGPSGPSTSPSTTLVGPPTATVASPAPGAGPTTVTIPSPVPHVALPPSPNASGSGASLAPPSPTAATIPTDILLAMRALPIGGVRSDGPTDAPVLPDRIVLRGPDPSLFEGQLRLTILTQNRFSQGQDSGTVTEQARLLILDAAPAISIGLSGLTNAVRQSARMLETLCKKTLDNLFRQEVEALQHWLEELGFVPMDFDFLRETKPTTKAPSSSGEEPNDSARLRALENTAQVLETEPAWGSVFIGLGLAGILGPRRQPPRYRQCGWSEQPLKKARMK